MPAIIQCTHCQATVEIDNEHLGMEVECGNCHRVFKAVASSSTGASAKSNRDWGDRDDRDRDRDRRRVDDDEDDYDDQPRRRKRRGFVPDERSYTDAQEAVRGPATGLIAIGWFGVVAYLLIGIGLVAFGFVLMNEVKNQKNAANKPEEGAVVFMVLGAIVAIVGSVYSAVIAIGGHKLKALKSYAFPMTSAIMGITTIMLFHPCNPVNWAMMGIGIWTLVTMNRSDVKWAIERNQRPER